MRTAERGLKVTIADGDACWCASAAAPQDAEKLKTASAWWKRDGVNKKIVRGITLHPASPDAVIDRQTDRIPIAHRSVAT